MVSNSVNQYPLHRIHCNPWNQVDFNGFENAELTCTARIFNVARRKDTTMTSTFEIDFLEILTFLMGMMTG
ncbi:hypothetical protein DFR67_102280 [Williamsia limnetica]|uniref:Uncharacterized protein n=1 Tax=Williamsia limnetica TaxID=882452 RepID=A0A318RT54_WILLI|nr:hypothetical protein DFR67_102280 [Williamsia limnetica]